MVLSQRHHILNHYLGETGGKKRLFHGKGRRRGCESGEESEAEEVRVCYGEEDEMEMEESQSIGEPWDWGEEEEEEADETRTDQLRLRDEDGIVSSSLLVSQ